MTAKTIGVMTVDELIELYVRLSAEQGLALDLCRSSKLIQRFGRQLFGIDEELKQRRGDQRSALIPLFGHVNPWVRFNAACCLIGVVPTEARRIIQTIAESGLFPEAGHAAMFLSLHDGSLSDLAH